MKDDLTNEQIAELDANDWFVRHSGGPSHIHVLNANEPYYKDLIDRNLITWDKPKRGSGWSGEFRAVQLTDAGKAALDAVRDRIPAARAEAEAKHASESDAW